MGLAVKPTTNPGVPAEAFPGPLGVAAHVPSALRNVVVDPEEPGTRPEVVSKRLKLDIRFLSCCCMSGCMSAWGKCRGNTRRDLTPSKRHGRDQLPTIVSSKKRSELVAARQTNNSCHRFQ